MYLTKQQYLFNDFFPYVCEGADPLHVSVEGVEELEEDNP